MPNWRSSGKGSNVRHFKVKNKYFYPYYNSKIGFVFLTYDKIDEARENSKKLLNITSSTDLTEKRKIKRALVSAANKAKYEGHNEVAQIYKETYNKIEITPTKYQKHKKYGVYPHPKQAELENWAEKLMDNDISVKVRNKLSVGRIVELDRMSDGELMANIELESGKNIGAHLDEIGEVLEMSRPGSDGKYKHRWQISVQYFDEPRTFEDGSKR